MEYYKIQNRHNKDFLGVYCRESEASFFCAGFSWKDNEWHYKGPYLSDIIHGFDPYEEDSMWGFHLLDEEAIQISKEEAEELIGIKIDDEKIEEVIEEGLRKARENK